MVEFADLALVMVVGVAAGAINAVVGSGTLLTYPVLLALGLSPVVANGTSTTGLSVGGIGSAVAYRSELTQRFRILALPTALALVGGFIGASLVVRLPERVFTAVVPWLIFLAVVLVALQPMITRALRHRRRHLRGPGRDLPLWGLLVGTYGGYFGAAQGVMYLAILALRYDEDLQHANAAKNLMSPVANMAAAIVFVTSGLWVWPLSLALAFSSWFGGYYGGRVARKIPPTILRLIIIAVGTYAATYLLISSR